jgi:hypothetical protein
VAEKDQTLMFKKNKKTGKFFANNLIPSFKNKVWKKEDSLFVDIGPASIKEDKMIQPVCGNDGKTSTVVDLEQKPQALS